MESDKQPYEPPELVELGTVEEFTLGTLLGQRFDRQPGHYYP